MRGAEGRGGAGSMKTRVCSCSGFVWVNLGKLNQLFSPLLPCTPCKMHIRRCPSDGGSACVWQKALLPAPVAV